ncbi:MAG TPA: IS1 family transposase [Anaerolineales bacterium]|nr:IS1 family transposase [Anaerolineales bacterium]
MSLQGLWCASRAGVETRGKRTQKPIVLRAYQERVSLRGLPRVFDVHRQSLSRWIVNHVKSLPKLKDTLLPAQRDDVLEYDEAWSFVLKKVNKRWLWTVMCRRTRQIIAFVIGDRSENTCRRLWNKVPIEYRSCISYSDFWEAYQKVLSKETHHAVGKDSGQVSHMERWYCTLRQHQARYVRKTLSFSKRDAIHHMVTKWFIVDHNLARKQFASLTL